MLRTLGISAGYGLLPVLNRIDLDVAIGEVVGLLGRNGAGKTTLLRVIAGSLRASTGSIALRGSDVTSAPAFRRARAGIAHVPQGRSIFNQLTVRQNLEVGTRAATDRGDGRIPDDVYVYFPILHERQSQIAGTLSGGEQQMLAIARCLMGAPELIMFDEPSLGLAPNVVRSVLDTIRELNGEGITCLLVEQNVALSLKLASHAYVLENGRVTLSGSGSELLADDRVRSAYLGL